MTLEYLEIMEDVKKSKCEGVLDVRKQPYQLTSEIDKCFVINQDSVCPQRQ